VTLFPAGIFSPLFLFAQNAPALAGTAPRRAGKIRIDLIRDSTQTDNATIPESKQRIILFCRIPEVKLGVIERKNRRHDVVQ